jgi:hypothetical protein
MGAPRFSNSYILDGATMNTIIFDDTTPLDEVLKVLPENELDELDAIGDSRDDQRWKIGDKARVWIDDRSLPVMQICKIIGSRTDYGHERVRQFMYNSRFYHENAELRERYHMLRYSIFEYARQCSDPAEVLQKAMEGKLSVNQVKFTYLPISKQIDELMAKMPKPLARQAEEIIRTAIAKLRELAER